LNKERRTDGRMIVYEKYQIKSDLSKATVMHVAEKVGN